MPQLVTTRNFADNQVLFKVHLDTFLDDIEEWANDIKLDSQNIQVGGIIADNLATSAVTTAKIDTGAVTLAKLADAVVAKLVPTGAVSAYAGTTAPTGWLLCDGSAVSRVVQAALFAVIGTAHGSGDGSTTFNLPDYRGRFLRGRDAGQSRDPDASSRTAMASGGNTGDAVGSIQGHALDSHTHVADSHTHDRYTDNGADPNVSITEVQATAKASAVLSAPTETNLLEPVVVGIQNTGGNETRPINANVNYIIKV